MNKKRELYRHIRDSEHKFVTIEDVQKMVITIDRLKGIHTTRGAMLRLIERLRTDGVLVRTKVRGVYRVKEPEDV